MNLKQMLAAAAARYAGKTAIILDDRRLSYADLETASNKIAHALIEMGVRRGDRVAMLLTNSLEFVIAYFGVFKAGAIAVPLDVNCRSYELTSLLADFRPKVLIAEDPSLEPLIPLLPRFDSIGHVISVGSGGSGQFLSYQEIIRTGSTGRVEVEPEPEDIAQIAYTSGPAFSPRGAVLSHRCLVAETAIAADGFQQTDKDVAILFALPLHHMFGLVAVLLSSIYKGGTVVIVPGTGLSIGSLMAAVEREKGTVFMGVPYIFALAIDLAEKEGIKHDLSSLRLCVSAGAPLPMAVIQKFKQHYGFDIADCWGLTEATCHLTCPPLDGSGRLGSVGKALPGWEVRIVDDNGRELPPNQAGEMIVNGPVMTGYYRNPRATREVLKDGWLHSGDLGRMDEAGYLFITGRKKATIIVKGQNIYPDDVEHVLGQHPKVTEAAVMGIPDEIRGEIVGAAISLKTGEVATEQEIKHFCLERIASYKVPKRVVFLDYLPKAASGRIDKQAIRERLAIPPLFPEKVIS